MKRQKDSAATRQSHRATSKPASAGKPRPSVSQLERRRAMAVNAALAAIIVGLALGILYGSGVAYQAGYEAGLAMR